MFVSSQSTFKEPESKAQNKLYTKKTTFILQKRCSLKKLGARLKNNLRGTRLLGAIEESTYHWLLFLKLELRFRVTPNH